MTHVLNENEYHNSGAPNTKKIRTTTTVVQGGAEALRGRGAGGNQPQGGARGARPWGQKNPFLKVKVCYYRSFRPKKISIYSLTALFASRRDQEPSSKQLSQ